MAISGGVPGADENQESRDRGSQLDQGNNLGRSPPVCTGFWVHCADLDHLTYYDLGLLIIR